jgi:hypothetical protein
MSILTRKRLPIMTDVRARPPQLCIHPLSVYVCWRGAVRAYGLWSWSILQSGSDSGSWRSIAGRPMDSDLFGSVFEIHSSFAHIWLQPATKVPQGTRNSRPRPRPTLQTPTHDAGTSCCPIPARKIVVGMEELTHSEFDSF